MDRFAIGSGSVAAAHEKSLCGRKRRRALGSTERVDFAAQDIPHAAGVDRQVQAPPHPGRPAHMDAPRGCHRPVERRKHVIRDTGRRKGDRNERGKGHRRGESALGEQRCLHPSQLRLHRPGTTGANEENLTLHRTPRVTRSMPTLKRRPQARRYKRGACSGRARPATMRP